jgi:Xaa-Pro aminopeptidase
MTRLEEVGIPELLVPERQPIVPREEYERRVAALRERVEADAIVVYADREHYANLSFLSGIDPRFEEALLVVGDGKPALILGNEGVALAPLARIDADVLHCPSLGLMGQDRARGLRLDEALRRAGVHGRTAIVGWKYFEPEERLSIAAAAFVVDAVRELADEIVDATGALMNPRDGLRADNSADQIAAFEWAAARASRAVFQVVRAAEPGMTEREAAAAMGYAGEPLSAHIMLRSGPDLIGLGSPSDRRLEQGDPATVAIGYWGGLCCRAGLLDDGGDDHLERIAIPYWRAIAAWWEAIRIGVPGGEIDAQIRELAQPALNPGHLGHLDEWVHSPIRPGSTDPIRSGMVLQCDVIPTDGTANCEDTLAVADADLRRNLADRHPEAWARIRARREFVTQRLGLELAEEVLPLSAAPAYFPPLWLMPEHALVQDR